MGGFTLNDDYSMSAAPAAPSGPGKRDLDDLIFQEEGWLISDR